MNQSASPSKRKSPHADDTPSGDSSSASSDSTSSKRLQVDPTLVEGADDAPSSSNFACEETSTALSSLKRDNSFDFHEACMDNVFIGISGLIGAGKSTLATALAKQLNMPVYYEPVKNNIYLEDFYKDMKKHSFAMQVYLLNARFKQQQIIIWNGKGGVQDRTIYEDSIFAKMLYESGFMEQRDYITYLQLFEHMSNFMKRPNLIVHLDVSPEESLERIKERSRGMESGITLEYLQNLHRNYEEFIQNISRLVPVIKVNWSKYRTAEEMAQMIATEYKKLANVRVVNWENYATAPLGLFAFQRSSLQAGTHAGVIGSAAAWVYDMRWLTLGATI